MLNRDFNRQMGIPLMALAVLGFSCRSASRLSHSELARQDIEAGTPKYYMVTGPPLPRGTSEKLSPQRAALYQALHEHGIELVGGCVPMHNDEYNEVIAAHYDLPR